MKNKLIFFILLFTLTALSIVLVSCSGKDNKLGDKIQIWYYRYSGQDVSNVEKIIHKAEQYCDENNIPLEIFRYNSDTISVDDYILKRNVASAKGNVIIIDDLQKLHMIAKHHADYKNIDSYNNLLPAYKDKYFIPFRGVTYDAMPIENNVLEYYNIKSKNRIMTYANYLDLKQIMKEKGARYTLSKKEYFQLIDYQLYKNKLLFLNEFSEILDDKKSFMKALKKTCINVCKDIILNHNAKLQINDSSIIYDENSNLLLTDDISDNKIMNILAPSSFSIELSWREPTIKPDPIGKSYYILPFNYLYVTDNIFIYKKITDKRIYDLANHLINEETYMMLNDIDLKNPSEKCLGMLTPIFKLDKLKKVLALNDNLELIDNQYSEDERELVTLAYELLVKNEDKTKEIANEYFSNAIYHNKINFFIENLVQDIARKLSGDVLSLEKFNPNDKEINKMIDKKINEFIFNFNIYSK